MRCWWINLETNRERANKAITKFIWRDEDKLGGGKDREILYTVLRMGFWRWEFVETTSDQGGKWVPLLHIRLVCFRVFPHYHPQSKFFHCMQWCLVQYWEFWEDLWVIKTFCGYWRGHNFLSIAVFVCLHVQHFRVSSII